MILQGLPPASELAGTLTGVIALTLVVAAVAAAVAFPYRWYVRERVPAGLPVLIGLAVVATSIGTTGWLGQVIAGNDGLFSPLAILANTAVFVVAGLGALAGVSVGDRLAQHFGLDAGAVGDRLVETVGRVLTVELPAEIDDVAGYDRVDGSTKETLAGKTFVFPRRITVEELRSRLTQRIETDFGVGHVDMEIAEDGSVEYLAVGSRAAGLGPTLPPEIEAVAVQADPAYAASAGDLVQVWTTDPPERVATAHVRGVADDVVTLAVDAADVNALDDRTEYKLLTKPVAARPDREFAALLRGADETFATVTVGEGDIVGRTVGEVSPTVVAIVDAEGTVTTLPAADRTLSAGDELYVIGTSEALRKLEIAAGSRPAPVAAAPDADDADDD